MPLYASKSSAETISLQGENVNVETQLSSHLDVPEDKEHNMYLVRQWKWLMREMVAVVALSASSVAAIVVSAYVYVPLH
ncbi:hypothetical protein NDA18_003898 [Ustilago nuda]|nr:hypothetical protein NDA18_003898 [Ustilago nuda]